MIPPMNNTCPGETAQSRTVAKLKHRLRSGQFTNVMPGERELSKALAAGRGTIRKALAQLQEEGFLAAPDKNRARKIIRTSTSPVQSLPLLENAFASSPPFLSGTSPKAFGWNSINWKRRCGLKVWRFSWLKPHGQKKQSGHAAGKTGNRVSRLLLDTLPRHGRNTAVV